MLCPSLYPANLAFLTSESWGNSEVSFKVITFIIIPSIIHLFSNITLSIQCPKFIPVAPSPLQSWGDRGPVVIHSHFASNQPRWSGGGTDTSQPQLGKVPKKQRSPTVVCNYALFPHLLLAQLSGGRAHPTPGPAGCRGAGSCGHHDSNIILELVKKTCNLSQTTCYPMSMKSDRMLEDRLVVYNLLCTQGQVGKKGDKAARNRGAK